jgi:hypothetical protein
MINKKKLIALAVAAIASVWIAAGLTIVDNQKSKAVYSGSTPFVQGLDIDKIATIELAGSNDSFKLVKQGSTFMIPSKGNYPAHTPTINNLLSDITDINKEGKVTDNKENFESLGVAASKGRTTVKFLDSDGKEMSHAGVLIGLTQVDAGGSYIRHPGEDTVYLSRNVPYIRTAALDYINKKIIDITDEQIAKVTNGNTPASFTITKTNVGVALVNVPGGKQAKDSEVGQVVAALAGLSITDVHQEVDGVTFDKTYTCELTDSTVYRLLIGQKDDKFYIKCTASFIKKATVTNGTVANQAEAAKFGGQQVAATFSKRHSGWIYEVSSFVGNNLVKTFDELIEEIPADAKTAPATPAIPTTPGVGPVAPAAPLVPIAPAN